MDSPKLNADNLSKWLTLLGNLAVLVGIIFLAAEINQNTNMMQSQTRNSMTQNQMSFSAIVLENAEIQALFLKGAGSSDTSMYQEGELGRLSFLLNAQLRMWENEWYQYNQGLFEPNEFEPRMELWRGEMQSGRHSAIWGQFREAYSVEFRALIDEMIDEGR